MRVRYSECDPQGVVFNANYLMYFDQAITELWREAFGSYQQAVAEHGADLVVAEARLRYLAPLRFDDEFELTASVTSLGNTSITTRLTAQRDDTVAAEGELRHVFVDPQNGGKTTIPDSIRAALGNYTTD
jgi:acyl-CoA thioester hydrolase